MFPFSSITSISTLISVLVNILTFIFSILNIPSSFTFISVKTISFVPSVKISFSIVPLLFIFPFRFMFSSTLVSEFFVNILSLSSIFISTFKFDSRVPISVVL